MQMNQQLRTKFFIMGTIVLFVGTNLIPIISGNTATNDASTQNRGSGVDWWPMHQHDPQHSGISTSKAPNTKNVLWKFKDNRGMMNSPVISDNRVFIQSLGWHRNNYSGAFYCLDVETGGLIWNHQYGPDNITDATPCVDGDKVYAFVAHGWSGSVLCYRVQDGKLIWTRNNIGDGWGGATIVDGKLFFHVAYPKEILYCLNDSSGTTIWSRHILNISGFGGPTISNGKMYVVRWGCNINCVTCLNILNGQTLWNWTNPLNLSAGIEGVTGSPTMCDNRLYFGTEGFGNWNPITGQYIWHDGAMFCLDATNGTTIWQSTLRATFTFSNPVVYNNRVYMNTINCSTLCMDAKTGNIIWQRQVHEPKTKIRNNGPCSPSLADGKVYVDIASKWWGKLFCLNASTGKLLWTFIKPTLLSNSRQTPIADEKVFSVFGPCLIRNDWLYCFSDIDPHAPSTPTISGPRFMKAGTEYSFNFTAKDPDGDNVYFYVCWGDGTVDQWLGPYVSGQSVTLTHTWATDGSFEIRARAKDVNDLRGPVGIFN